MCIGAEKLYKPVNVVEVRIWGYLVGAVTLDPSTGYYVFEYDKKWTDRGIELSPFNLSTSNTSRLFQFPNLSVDTYKRLPAMNRH